MLATQNSDANTFTAYDPRSRSLVIVSTNSTTSTNTVTYDLSNFNLVGRSATPYQTSANENLQQLSNIAISNKSFSAALPAQSITTFVIPNVIYFGRPGSAYYKIVNHNSGKVLEVASSSTANGGIVDQWIDNGGTNQQWQIFPSFGGYIRLVNRNSSKVLEVAAFSTADGGTVDQWTNNGGTNQQWSLVQVSAS